MQNKENDVSLREVVQLEYARSMTECAHFLKQYSKIEHPMRGSIYFNLYPFQEDVLDEFESHRFNIILKSRQLGISTLTAGYALWKLLSSPSFKVLVIATKQDVAINLVHKVKYMFTNLPSWLKKSITVIDNNKTELSFSNGSKIKAVSASGDAGRSEALSLLIIDEAAFIQNIDSIWKASQSTLSTGGNCIVLSTPNGVGNLFHQLWTKAVSGVKDDEDIEIFNPIYLNWRVHPERDQAWRDQQTALLGERGAAQECDGDFLTSGHTVVDGEALKYYKDTWISDPIEKRGYAGDYWLWDYPNYTKSYVVVGDTARGDGADYSAFSIFELESMMQVGEYKGKLPPNEFGKMLVYIGKEWNNALLVVEHNNVGWATIQEILDDGYDNLYYTYHADPYLDSNIHIAKMFDLAGKEDMVPGFDTNGHTRPIMVSKLESYTRNKEIIIKSIRTLDELYTFKWIKGKAKAAEGYNDDLVMVLCIFLFVCDTALKLKQYGIDIQKKAVENSFRGIHRVGLEKKSPFVINSGRSTLDISWLVRKK